MTLTPQVRPDRNGKMVTRHVKTDAVPTQSKTLPPPPSLSALSKQPMTSEDIIHDAMMLHFPEEEVEDLISYFMRKSPVVLDALARELSDASDSDRFHAAITVVTEINDPVLCVLALHDTDFIVDLAKPPYGSPADATIKYRESAVSSMRQAYSEHFVRNAMDPETMDVESYSRFLRAATITQVLALDSQVPTSMDAHKQREHVADNMSTFSRHYPSLVRIVQATNLSGANMDSRVMLDVCSVLDENPGANDILVSYINDRKRFVMEEFKLLLDGPSRSLSSGSL